MEHRIIFSDNDLRCVETSKVKINRGVYPDEPEGLSACNAYVLECKIRNAIIKELPNWTDAELIDLMHINHLEHLDAQGYILGEWLFSIPISELKNLNKLCQEGQFRQALECLYNINKDTLNHKIGSKRKKDNTIGRPLQRPLPEPEAPRPHHKGGGRRGGHGIAGKTGDTQILI